MTRSMPTAAELERWNRLWFDGSVLMAEAAMVMAMRSWRMAMGGPAAAREAERMMSEKIEAGFELGGAFASGRVRSPEGAARKAIGVYGKRVRANRKRLG